MKLIRVLNTAILSLTLGIALPVYALQEKRGDKQDHPQEQQAKHELAKPAQQHAQPQRQEKQQPAQHASHQSGQAQSHRAPQEQTKPSAQHAQQQRQPAQREKATQHAQ